MEMCMIALQNRRIIDRNMNGCFNKTEGLLMERWMVAFTRNDYRWKDVWLLLQKMTIDGKMYGCFTRQQAYWWKYAWLLIQKRKTIDGNMYGCFDKTEGLLMERWMVVF